MHRLTNVIQERGRRESAGVRSALLSSQQHSGGWGTADALYSLVGITGLYCVQFSVVAQCQCIDRRMLYRSGGGERVQGFGPLSFLHSSTAEDGAQQMPFIHCLGSRSEERRVGKVWHSANA